LLKLGNLALSSPFGLAPMAGLTDSALRRLIKRHGGCALVMTEMVSAEGLVRGGGRTREYAAFAAEERPVAVQVFGGDPDRMAAAARVVESLGADVVDVNMGCPVRKVASRSAGCSLMREPDRAAAIVAAMTRAVRIPVTVKMRAGWDERELNAPLLARMVEQAGASAVAVHGRTAAQAYRGTADWDLIARVARAVSIPVFGNGDCLDPAGIVDRWRSSGAGGILVGRGALRNPWLLAQAADLAVGGLPRLVSPADHARFLLDYIDLLSGPPADAAGNRESEARSAGRARSTTEAGSRERWIVGKLRALVAWHTKGVDNGSHLRVTINRAGSVQEVRDAIDRFFLEAEPGGSARRGAADADLRV
jgi:tRNA-dihydrouridine synthase B